MYLAIDIGGTKTLVAVFDASGAVAKQVKFPTPEDYETFIQALGEHVKELGVEDFRAAGIAIPGKVDRKNGVGIAFGNLTWRNVPIQADCEKIINAPIVIENDANLAGLSEAILLKDKYKKVFYITISTGIGGIYVVNGKIDENTQDAEVGHMLLEYRGESVIWEKFASGKAIFEKYGKKAVEIDDPEAWEEISRNIAIGLYACIASYTPEAIVIGGGVGAHLDRFKSYLDAALKKYENPIVTLPPVLQAQRPEEAVIYGCYELAKERYGHVAR